MRPRAPGYPSPMTETSPEHPTTPDTHTDPDDRPLEQPSGQPFEPSVTNPDADGTDVEPR